MDKKTYCGKAYTDAGTASVINMALTKDGYFGEDDTISITITFLEGYEMDIKCCGVQYEEGGNNVAWTEAVLFKDGCEVACSEPSEEFFGEWELEDKGITFKGEVLVCN